MPSSRRKPANKTVQLTLRVPKALHDQAVRYAQTNDLTLAQVIRQALRAHVSG